MVKLIDLAGKTFGRITVLGRADGGKRVRWNCVCKCGTTTIVDGANLRTGNTTSCGCQRQDSKTKIRPGMVFGRLKVLARDGVKRYGKIPMSMWHCVCECGKFKSVLGMSLMNGDTKSCGCLHSESSSKNGAMSLDDLTGREYGELVVIERATNGKNEIVKWLCACSCGNLTILRGYSITAGITISCGCKKSDGNTYRKDTILLKKKIQGARRRAAEIAATLSFDKELFLMVENEAYSLAMLRSEITQAEWHVDHKVPLKSEFVCGLHNEYNLAVIPASDNVKKKNRWWEDMP